jgi:hypothetical protein
MENKGILIKINPMIPITHNYTKCSCLDLKSGKIYIVHAQMLYSEPKHFHHSFLELCFCLQPHFLACWITITLLHAEFQNLKLFPNTILNNKQLKLSDKYLFNGMHFLSYLNPLNTELNPICHLLALLGAHPILHVSRAWVKNVWFQLLLEYLPHIQFQI